MLLPRSIWFLSIEKLKEEYVVLFNKKFRINYSKWPLNSEQPACKVTDDMIEINSIYPFFESKTYGNLFKKLHIILAISFKESKNKNEYHSKIIESIESELKEFL